MTEHVDMAQFVEAKSDQLGADDLIGAPRTVTVTRVTGHDGEQPVAVHFQGDNGKPWRPCKTMRRVLLSVWGRHAADYVGRSMTLYRDDTVTFGGLNVGGIRISHMSHIDAEKVVVVAKTKGKKAGIKVLPLQAERPSATTTTAPQPARQTPEEWTDDYIAKVKACPTLDELVRLQTKAERALAKLKTDRDDLHELAVNAGTARAAELQAADIAPAEDDPFAEPA